MIPINPMAPSYILQPPSGRLPKTDSIWWSTLTHKKLLSAWFICKAHFPHQHCMVLVTTSTESLCTIWPNYVESGFQHRSQLSAAFIVGDRQGYNPRISSEASEKIPLVAKVCYSALVLPGASPNLMDFRGGHHHHHQGEVSNLNLTGITCVEMPTLCLEKPSYLFPKPSRQDCSPPFPNALKCFQVRLKLTLQKSTNLAKEGDRS